MRDRGRRGKKRIGWSLVRSSSSDDREKAHRKPNTIASLLVLLFLRPGGISIGLFAYGTSPDDLFHVSFQILGGGDNIKRDPYGENKKQGNWKLTNTMDSWFVRLLSTRYFCFSF